MLSTISIVVHMQQIYNTFRTIYETESIPRKRCLCTLLRSWLFPSSSKFNPKISCFKCANKNIWLKWKRPKVNCGESRKKAPTTVIIVGPFPLYVPDVLFSFWLVFMAAVRTISLFSRSFRCDKATMHKHTFK